MQDVPARPAPRSQNSELSIFEASKPRPPLAAAATSPMRVAVLAHNLRTAGGMSVGRNLVAALIRRAPEWSYLFLIPGGTGYEDICAEAIRGTSCTYDHERGGIVRRALFDLVKLPRVVRSFQPDWVLGLGNAGLFRPPCAQAVLCQNAYCCYPTSQLPRETWRTNFRYTIERWMLARQLRRTDLLLCQTSAYEQRIRSAFGFTGPTTLCPNAVSMFVRESAARQPLPSMLRTHRDKYKLFYVARYYNHKNLEALVKLFQTHRQQLADCVAIITIEAKQHPNASRLLDEIKRHGLQDQIINVGPLRQQEIAAYFQTCDALLMPSLLESFSGTYLESMYYELPILTSDRDFARAVCGDAALYFDPLDVKSIYQSVAQVRENDDLRHELTQRGRARLAQFPQSWDDVADRVLGRLVELHRGRVGLAA